MARRNRLRTIAEATLYEALFLNYRGQVRLANEYMTEVALYASDVENFDGLEEVEEIEEIDGKQEGNEVDTIRLGWC